MELYEAIEGHDLVAILKVGVSGEETGPTPSKRPEFSWLHRNRFGNKEKGHSNHENPELLKLMKS